jgi:hypothetical protein
MTTKKWKLTEERRRMEACNGSKERRQIEEDWKGSKRGGAVWKCRTECGR